MERRCPLCDTECKSPAHVRQHLHVSHRKSAIIEAYIEEHDELDERRAVPAE